MKLKISLIIWCLLNISYIANAQQLKVINGIVKDKLTNENIIDAEIILLPFEAKTSSDNNGHFMLSYLQGDSIIINISKSGYETLQQMVDSSIKQIVFYVTPKQYTKQLSKIVVKGNNVNKVGISLVEIPMNKIKLLPTIAGEVDVLKAYQLMPGIQGGSEGSSGLYIRGGSPDQNLILIDDVPVYNVSHLGGFLSILDVNAVNKISIIKGGFPARFGGRLSSVVDVRMKEGNANKTKFKYDLGLISTKLFVEGPLKNIKTKYMFSIRRFNLDIPARILSTTQNNGQLLAGYSFYDVYAKITHDISKNKKLSLFVYNGRDNIFLYQNSEIDNLLFKSKSKLSSTIKWGNTLVGLKYVNYVQPKLNLATTLSYTLFRYSTDLFNTETNLSSNLKTIESSQQFLSSIRDYSLKQEVNYFVSEKSKLKTGFIFISKIAKPASQSINYKDSSLQFDTSYAAVQINANEAIVYAEIDKQFSDKWKVNMGVHVNQFFANQFANTSIQPRLLITYKPNDFFNSNFGYSIMNQNLHLLTNNNAGLPTDLWVPATKVAVPSNCHQVSWANNYLTHNRIFQFSADVYYKYFNHLIEFKDGISFTNFRSDWEQKIETNGIGHAYGLELLAEKKEGRLNGWVGYTLAFNNRRFDNINSGKIFPYKFDRRHSLTVTANYNLKENIILSSAFVMNTGFAITLPSGSYPTINPANNNGQNVNNNFPLLGSSSLDKTFIYTSRNNDRMPLYHRLDVSITFHKNKLHGGSRDWVISFYNIYSKQNPYFYYFEKDKAQKLHLYQLSLFPIIPSISYNRTF
jgi:TonB-dependent Receptor Plug Domain/CarboxypepD_reg-like domain